VSPPPPIPTACASLQSEVASLEAQAQTLRNDALAAVGAAAWAKLADLAQVLLALDRKRDEYQRCLDAHSGSLVCQLVLIDAGGGGTADARRADLWDVSGGEPVLLETVPVQSGSFAFSGPVPPGGVAVTIAGTDTTIATGPDFRSGPITAPPAQPQVEVVLGPLVTITADDTSRWFSALTPLPPERLEVSGVGSVSVNLQSIAATLAPPAIRLTGVGTVTASVALLGEVDSPLSATISLGLVPSTAPDPLLPAELSLAAPPHVDLAGPAAAFGAVLNAALVGFLGNWILELMKPIVRDEISSAAARALSLVGLPPPPTVTLSIRKLSIGASSVTLQPVLGGVGTVLSTFQPSGAQVVTP
jgi:hypothetical protein